ncbi:hypothetical protein ABZP36_030892 [Zizania latifolia]
MATEWSDGGEEFSLPDEFLDDDFFSEEEKAAVAARSESDEEDCLAGVTRRLAVLLGDDGERAPPSKAEVTVGSPQSTLCGLPKSGQETPNGGASQGNSPPSSPLEQNPADPWDLLFEAAGEVARMRVSNKIPEPSNPYGFHVCSTVLVPARVVQALNLNLDDLGAQPRYPGGFVLDHVHRRALRENDASGASAPPSEAWLARMIQRWYSWKRVALASVAYWRIRMGFDTADRLVQRHCRPAEVCKLREAKARLSGKVISSLRNKDFSVFLYGHGDLAVPARAKPSTTPTTDAAGSLSSSNQTMDGLDMARMTDRLQSCNPSRILTPLLKMSSWILGLND